MKKRIRIGKGMILALFCFFALAPVAVTCMGSFVSESVIEEHFGGLLDYTQSWHILSFNEWLQNTSLEQYCTVLLQSPDFLFRLWRSIFLVVPIICLQLVISVPAAYAFSQTKKKWMTLLFFLYLFFLLLPVQVTVIPNYLMAYRLNIVDTDWSVWLPGITSPFSVYLLTRSMNRIPSEILEAARMDGAKEGKILRRIVVPLCQGQLAVCVILLFADYWNMVELPAIMFSNDLSYPLSVFLSKIQEGAIGIAFAASVVYMIPAILIFLFGEEYLLNIDDTRLKR